MNLDELRSIFIISGIFAILVLTFPVLTDIFTPAQEPFIAMAVLGKGVQSEDYSPNKELNISIGESIPWQVYIYNQMGKAQYVAIKFKILNKNSAAPNSSLCYPSPSHTIYEVRKVLLSNETKLIPFIWEIIEARNDTSTINISKIKINDHLLDVNAVIPSDESTRVVFELWLYNTDSEEFSFAWSSQGVLRCVWNKIWLNLML